MNLLKYNRINKILLFRLSSMGDIILTTPLARILRTQFPNAQIDVVTAKEFSEIYYFNPHINILIQYDKSDYLSQIDEIKKELLEKNNNNRYDLFIDLQNNIRSRHFISKLAKRVVFIKKNRLKKLSLVHFKKNLFSPIPPIPLNYIDSLSKLNIRDDSGGLELWLPEEKRKGFYPPDSRQTPVKGKIKIAVAPGAFHKTKRYPVEYLSLALNKIKELIKPEIYIIGGRNDKDTTNELISKLSFKPVDCSGATSIIETARRINGCHLLLTNDTGVMHIAAARRVPVVAIFGSTVPELGFAPYRVKHKILQADVSCRPCTHIGRAECPKKHFRCMAEITPDKVVNAVIETVLI
jgi:ADP-heptose:LPS heptosyltransferase